jgi:hypothetical protein
MTQESKIAVQKISLEDGRLAERHSYVDENGNEVIELFAEEVKPLHIEQRIIREYKNVVAKETRQTFQNGEVVQQEVLSTEPDVPLQIRERIAVKAPEVPENSFATKADLDEMVSRLTYQMQIKDPPVSNIPLTAQALVEKNVEEKNQNKLVINLVLAAILLVNVAFIGYVYFLM